MLYQALGGPSFCTNQPSPHVQAYPKKTSTRETVGSKGTCTLNSESHFLFTHFLCPIPARCPQGPLWVSWTKDTLTRVVTHLVRALLSSQLQEIHPWDPGREDPPSSRGATGNGVGPVWEGHQPQARAEPVAKGTALDMCSPRPGPSSSEMGDLRPAPFPL